WGEADLLFETLNEPFRTQTNSVGHQPDVRGQRIAIEDIQREDDSWMQGGRTEHRAKQMLNHVELCLRIVPFEELLAKLRNSCASPQAIERCVGVSRFVRWRSDKCGAATGLEVDPGDVFLLRRIDDLETRLGASQDRSCC